MSKERCSHCTKRLCRKAECRKPGAERGLVWGGVIEGGEGAHSARQRLDTVQKSWRMAPGASAENRHNHDATTVSPAG